MTFSADGSSLVTLGSDNVLRTWPLAQALRPWAPTSERLAPAVLESLWKDLLDGDPVYGYAAVRNLAARPEQALPLLRERVKPVPAIDSGRVKELVKILTQDDFNARKRAAAELRKFADLALPVLRAVNQRGGYNEMLMRMQDRLEADYPTLDQLRTLRALEVLELIGTAEAKKLLDDLAGGAAESLLTQRAKAIRAGLDKAAAPVNLVVPSDDLWTALADVDAARAFAAIRTLWAAPDKAVPFLRERLKGVAALTAFDDDPERIAKLITDLDSDDFAVREQATKSLAALGKAAEAALQKALAENPSIEARKRIDILLKDVDRAALTPERLRAARCLEVLEGLGDEAARPVLAALAQEAKNRWLKDAAADSLRRLRK